MQMDHLKRAASEVREHSSMNRMTEIYSLDIAAQADYTYGRFIF